MQNDIPNWLAAFATDVSELIRNRKAETQFKDAVREWAKALDPKDYPIPFSHEHPLTLTEKYAVLAGVCDYVHRGGKPIGPSLSEMPEPSDIRMSAAYCAFVRGKVPELTEADLPDLKLCLADVEADFGTRATQRDGEQITDNPAKSKRSILQRIIESISSGVTKGTLDHLDK